MTDPKHKIGWNLPGHCDPQCDQGHPSAPEGIPCLPKVHIPNQTATPGPVCNRLDCPPDCGFMGFVEVPQEARNLNVSPERQKLDKNEFWIKGSKGSIPAGAIEGGQDVDGELLYVARAEFEGSLTPGKLNSSGCHIPWGSAERKMDEYEVLCDVKGQWIRSDRDQIPEKALKAGYSEEGEILYVGRAKHQGNLIPGKVQPSHKLCYVSFGGKELSYQAYEIFVVEE